MRSGSRRPDLCGNCISGHMFCWERGDKRTCCKSVTSTGVRLLETWILMKRLLHFFLRSGTYTIFWIVNLTISSPDGFKYIMISEGPSMLNLNLIFCCLQLTDYNLEQCILMILITEWALFFTCCYKVSYSVFSIEIDCLELSYTLSYFSKVISFFNPQHHICSIPVVSRFSFFLIYKLVHWVWIRMYQSLVRGL